MTKINSRQKGKRGERFIKNLLKPIFPEIQRNYNEQSELGGVDFKNTDPFDFEVKYGNAYKIVKVRKMLNQVEHEGKDTNFKCVIVKPQNEEEYCLLPLSDMIEIMNKLKVNGII